MGYESRLYFIDNSYGSGLDVAMVDLGKMGDNSFYELFKYPYEQGLSVDMACMDIPDEYQKYYPNIEYIPDVRIYEDRYGKKLKYCTINELYEWCKKHKKDSNYRRLKVLYKLAKEFRKTDRWGNGIIVVHFGH